MDEWPKGNRSAGHFPLSRAKVLKPIFSIAIFLVDYPKTHNSVMK